MTKEELYWAVKSLLYWDNQFVLTREYYIWKYNYTIIWNCVKLTIEKKDDIRIFRKLIIEFEAFIPEYYSLSYEASLELLYHHYPRWYDNWSNAILVNELWDVIAIQWNGLKTTTTVSSAGIKSDKIIINNSKQLDYQIKYKDLDQITDWLNKNFSN